MGPAQCLPTEWPGSASVRPGGTGPDVALSLSRAVTIRLIMIEVRMFSIVHSLFLMIQKVLIFLHIISTFY